jgi:uncharacterized phage-associated protein
MPAPFPVKAVANAILEKAFAERKPITPLKLQKLLYYAHGYYSGAYRKALIDQPFEAWQYGPVAPAIYHEFKNFGNTPITRLAEEHDWDIDDSIPVVADFDDDSNVRRVINYVWRQYAALPATTLSEMTHQSGSPWDKTIKSNVFGLKNVDIDQSVIQEYFSRLVTRKAA